MTLKKDSIPSAKSGRNGRNMKILGISIPVLTVSVFLFSFGVFNSVNKDTSYKSNEVALSSVENVNYATGNYSILGMMDTLGQTNLTQNTREVAIALGNEEVKQIKVAEAAPDTTAPVITLKQQEIKIKAGETLNLNNNIASVTDNLDGNSAKYTVTGNVNKNVAGDYTVTVKATDANNNISTTSYKVKVEANPNVQAQNTTNNETTTNAPSTVDTSNVVSVAKSLIGTRYRGGGTSPSTGFDCSGFTSYVYKQVGKNISRSSRAQASNGSAVSESNLQAGDIILWANNGSNSISHSSLYIGGGQIIHATSNKGVRITSVSAWKNWGQHIVSIRRV